MNVSLILAPYDTARRGWRAGAGPGHLVDTGLVEHLARQGHRVTDRHVVEDDSPEDPAEIRTAFALMRGIASAARAARRAGNVPLILSGNCNAGAIGVLSALTPGPRAIFWFDAHGESNTPETTGSGFLDGMGLSIALGWCWRAIATSVPGFHPVPEESTFLIGARDLDAMEEARLTESKVHRLSVDELEAELHLSRESLRRSQGYLHLDLDVLDPQLVGRANSLPAPGGLSVPQLLAAIRTIRSHVPLAGLTLASYAPEYDEGNRIRDAAFAAIAASLADGSS